MKKIEKYVTRDGAEFSDESKAQARERLLDEIDAIENDLPKKDESSNFVNGHGYIQHDSVSIIRARTRMLELACKYVFSDIYKFHFRDYVFGRYLDDNSLPLYRLYVRIVLCIDDNTWREYGQPYYAFHPEQAKPF